MSDIMLNAVIQMPYEMAMKDELSRRQFYERANQALNDRNSKEAEIERLKKALRVAVLALAHATEEHGKVYEPAYDAVQIALYGEPDA
ncbi:hypothetical protein [Alcaligenes faecalis]|uniref:hypothetical protein n=1 Tax=Alcaligenes faecalis TaxID=511 RepID=UPI0005A650B9|nr:hypothetical protein [Alcaligenes faecalis]ATH99506.1 hypothetical protein CPY64_07080 [Alcaligenes faecalis]AYZ92293.1 hypothetical protein EGY22_12850 [Alcaligenes faecalis]MCX5593032.1 hypothetical protein [Alcaligenes faecalis]QQC31903.1 hypothetical protein I6H81_14805 [Alcaligenes faecalis]CAJ0903100.1 CopG family transcriptional regulator [Alcaligenes faecalis subsp. faecalis]